MHMMESESLNEIDAAARVPFPVPLVYALRTPKCDHDDICIDCDVGDDEGTRQTDF